MGYSSTSPLFSLRLFCLLLSSTQICCFFTELLQRRDLYDIFASARQGPFCPFTFQYFFSRNDVFNQRFRGAEGESYPQSPPAGALLLKKEKKKKILWTPHGGRRDSEWVSSVLVFFVAK